MTHQRVYDNFSPLSLFFYVFPMIAKIDYASRYDSV